MHVITSFDSPIELFSATYIAEVVSGSGSREPLSGTSAIAEFRRRCRSGCGGLGPGRCSFCRKQARRVHVTGVGDEVLVSFINRDPRFPVVVGGLWNGDAGPPETLGGSGDQIDRWTIVGKAGTRIAIVEEGEGAVVSFKTPNGVSGELTDKVVGKIEFKGCRHNDHCGYKWRFSADACKSQSSGEPG